MSADSEFAQVIARIATIPSILRARTDDVARSERHGALNGEREARLAVTVKQLRKIAAELEKSIS